MSRFTSRPNILVIGETCLDIHIYGDVKRLCPEGPVPIITPKSRDITFGMAGNVFANLKSLGWPSPNVIAIFPSADIKKTRYLDAESGQLMLRVDEGEPIPTKERFDIKLLKGIDFGKTAACIISDYGKGFLSSSDITEISRLATETNCPTFLDTKLILGTWSSNVDFVKINWKEYQNQLAAGVGAPQKYCKNLLVSKGSEGVWWVNRDMLITPEKPVIVSNVSGAGDSLLAGIVIEYLRTESIISAIKYGNKVASVAVSKRGVVAVKKEEVS